MGIRAVCPPTSDTGHKARALCPVSRYVDRAYLWAPALGTGHTCVSHKTMDGRAWNSGYYLSIDGGKTELWYRSVNDMRRVVNDAGVVVSRGRASIALLMLVWRGPIRTTPQCRARNILSLERVKFLPVSRCKIRYLDWYFIVHSEFRIVCILIFSNLDSEKAHGNWWNSRLH